MVASLAFATSAEACKCKAPPPPKEALAASAAVFSGKVTKIEPDRGYGLLVTLKVASVWKGVDGAEVVVHTPRDSAACGVSFKEGSEFLVYADKMKGDDIELLTTNLCTRTKLLADAKEDLAELGPAGPAK